MEMDDARYKKIYNRAREVCLLRVITSEQAICHIKIQRYGVTHKAVGVSGGGVTVSKKAYAVYEPCEPDKYKTCPLFVFTEALAAKITKRSGV